MLNHFDIAELLPHEICDKSIAPVLIVRAKHDRNHFLSCPMLDQIAGQGTCNRVCLRHSIFDRDGDMVIVDEGKWQGREFNRFIQRRCNHIVYRLFRWHATNAYFRCEVRELQADFSGSDLRFKASGLFHRSFTFAR